MCIMFFSRVFECIFISLGDGDEYGDYNGVIGSDNVDRMMKVSDSDKSNRILIIIVNVWREPKRRSYYA